MDSRKEMKKQKAVKKAEGREPRIRLPVSVAPHLFNLTKDLGFKTDGETVSWLLRKAEPYISGARGLHGVNTTPANDVVINHGNYHYTNSDNFVTNVFPYAAASTGPREVFPVPTLTDYTPNVTITGNTVGGNHSVYSVGTESEAAGYGTVTDAASEAATTATDAASEATIPATYTV